MRLVDLYPRWALGTRWDDPNGLQHYDMSCRNGMGMTFNCPIHPHHRLAIFFQNPIDGLPPQHGEQFLWMRKGSDFETLSVYPSINAEVHGCWHGYITDGLVDNSLSPF